jgi:hypothetical protein
MDGGPAPQLRAARKGRNDDPLATAGVAKKKTMPEIRAEAARKRKVKADKLQAEEDEEVRVHSQERLLAELEDCRQLEEDEEEDLRRDPSLQYKPAPRPPKTPLPALLLMSDEESDVEEFGGGADDEVEAEDPIAASDLEDGAEDGEGQSSDGTAVCLLALVHDVDFDLTFRRPVCNSATTYYPPRRC